MSDSLQRDPEDNERKFLQRSTQFAGKRVLEIGCGEGRLTWKLAPSSMRTVGLDPDLDALRVARADTPHDLRAQVSFAAVRGENLPFAREKFDIAVLAWSL